MQLPDEQNDSNVEPFNKLNESVTQVRLDIRELMTEIRSLKSLQETVNNHESRISKSEDSSSSAHKRLDKVDKMVFWIATLIIGSVIVGVISLAMSTSI